MTATMNRIRQAAIDNGWTIKARVGETIYAGRTARYRRDGAVRHASAYSFIPALGVVCRRGISTIRTEKRKADRIIAALTAGTSEIPL